MGAVTVNLAVLDNQGTPAPVDGVLFRIFDDSDVFVTEVSTGNVTPGSGVADVTLDGTASPGTEYIVRLYKAGLSFSGGPTQRIQILDPLVPPETNIFDFEALLPVVNASQDPQMCRITGRLVDDSLRPLPNKRVDFIRHQGRLSGVVSGFSSSQDPQVIRDNILVAPVAIQTDSDGRVDVELPRGGIFEVRIQGYQLPGWATDGAVRLIEVLVPDQSAIELMELLYPFVEEVNFDPNTASVAVGESAEIGLTVTGSNEQDITAMTALVALLDFTVDDEAIAQIKIEEEKLLVYGVAVGSAVITVTRKDGTWAPRSPAIPDLVANQIDVTVTA